MSIDGQLGKDPQRLEGLPLTMLIDSQLGKDPQMLILGGSIDGQLGKDP